MNRTNTVLGWIERALIAVALVCGLWSLISAAQTRFYASLPVPSYSARALELPGEGERPGTSPGTAGLDHADSRARRRPIAPGEWVARLEAPSVGLTATVIEGSTDDMLAKAAGHIEDTAFPGEPGNVGIAGHRDTTFRAVRHLRVGDRLKLTTTRGVFDYRIVRTLIVNPGDVQVLDPTDTPTLTLVTCYPFTFIGRAPQRFIVQAAREDGPRRPDRSG